MRGFDDGGLRGLLLLRLGLDDLAGLRVDERVLDDDRLGFPALGLELGHVRAVAAVLGDDHLARARVDAEHAVARDGGVDELAGLRRGELVGREVVGEVDAARRLATSSVGDLEVRAVLADAQRDVVADRERVDLAGVDLAEVVDDLAEAAVACRRRSRSPLSQSARSASPSAIRSRSSSISAVKSYSTRSPKCSSSSRTTVNAIQFGTSACAARGDVAAVDDRGDDRRVRRRAADAELLERLHEARLGVARRSGWSRGPSPRARRGRAPGPP